MSFPRCLLLLILALGLLLVPLPARAAAAPCPDDMAFIPGGTFTMGSENPDLVEEKIAEDVTISSFCMEPHEVTNAQFAAFVADTGYVTVAERPLSKAQFPDLSEAQRAPGSLVFQPPAEGIQQVAYLSWWRWTLGANWQHPYGPNSDLRGKENHPVVHVAYEDAVAYAAWADRQLPSEAQWEYAARGGAVGWTYTWGEQYSAKQANTWQGLFPFFNTQADGHLGTAPVMSYPANGYNLYDMTGNVWELTSSWYTVLHDDLAHRHDPTGPSQVQSYDPKKPQDGATHVIKGGSYLCAKNYCSRYRPAARESQAVDTGTTHVGFRLVKAIAPAS
jgi:formylglycine-generating enzyme